jgi:hypothetical protein
MDRIKMEFNEQPLTYQEAVNQVLRFERLYKMRSEDFFQSLDKGVCNVEVHADDQYEWRSYFSFKLEMDARISEMLHDTEEPIQEVVYSPNSGLHTRVKGQARSENSNLALAA